MAKDAPKNVAEFLSGKSPHAKELFQYLVDAFKKEGDIQVLPAKTMIGIATPRKRIAYVTQVAKEFIHVVFPFEKAHHNNLCFQKIAQVPGSSMQFNHHFRMYRKEDLNEEVRGFMRLACRLGS